MTPPVKSPSQISHPNLPVKSPSQISVVCLWCYRCLRWRPRQVLVPWGSTQPYALGSILSTKTAALSRLWNPFDSLALPPHCHCQHYCSVLTTSARTPAVPPPPPSGPPDSLGETLRRIRLPTGRRWWRCGRWPDTRADDPILGTGGGGVQG